MKIETFSSRNLVGLKRWYFRVRAMNGHVLVQSEGYSRRVDMLGTIHSLKSGMSRAEIIDG